MKQAEAVLRRHSYATSTPLFALKVDVSRFFPSLCQEVLLALLRKNLENGFFVWLVEVIVRHRATDAGHYRLDSPRSDWRLIEPEKSLFRVSRSRGLPIGNLTSQFFANVYMHPFDVFLANKRKGRFLYAQRYVDDVLVLGEDKEALAALVPEMEFFLENTLSLRLNPKKTILRPLAHGIDHLGFFIKPSRTTVRRSVKRRAEKRVLESRQDDEETVQSVQASFGHALHGKNERWRRELARRLRAVRPGLAVTVSPGARKIERLTKPNRRLTFEESIGAKDIESENGTFL